MINLGIAHLQMMRLEVALPLFRRALSMCRVLGDRVGFGRALNHLGKTLVHLGRPGFAMLCHQWAMSLFQQAGHLYHENSARHNMALGQRLLGQLDRAAELYLRNAAIYRSLGNRLHTGRALDFLGVVYREQGRVDEAISCHRQNLEICAETLDVHGAARGNANLAVSYREAGRLEEAIACHQDALRTFRVTGPRYLEGTALVELGRTFRHSERYVEAARCFLEALEAFDEVRGSGSALAEQTAAVRAELNEITAIIALATRATEDG